MKRCLTIFVFVFAALALAVVLIDRSSALPSRSLEAVMRDTAIDVYPLMTNGAVNEQAAIAQFREFWSELSEARIQSHMQDVYAEDVWFNDTLKTIEGRDSLQQYIMHTQASVSSCRVDVTDIAYSDGNYYARWSMTIVPKGTQPHAAWRSYGMTHLRFNSDGQVVLHQDYWDAAGGLYEHLPIIGWMLRNIRARI